MEYLAGLKVVESHFLGTDTLTIRRPRKYRERLVKRSQPKGFKPSNEVIIDETNGTIIMHPSVACKLRQAGKMESASDHYKAPNYFGTSLRGYPV